MHTRELIELAALAATYAEPLVRGDHAIPERCVEQYWVASKSRLDRWGRCLKRLTVRGPESKRARGDNPTWIRGLLEEILASEPLARIWAAVLLAYDRLGGGGEMGPIARNVLSGHLEARHRLLALMVCSPRIDAELAIQLNQLRRRCERWTDVLIGFMADMPGVLDVAANRRRAWDFGEDFRYQRSRVGGQHVWPLMLDSFRAAFHRVLGPASPNPDLNARIASSILACLHPHLLDAAELPYSAWHLKVSAIAQDAETMIDDLLASEAARPAQGAGEPSGLWPWRRFEL